MTARGVAGIMVVAAIGAAIAVGLVLLEPPSEARARRLDERRVDDLVQLARDVRAYWTRRSSLPASLEDLAHETGLGLRRTDPATGAPYAYRIIDADRYELCAEFSTETSPAETARREPFWAHGRGRECFTVDVREPDPDRARRRSPRAG